MLKHRYSHTPLLLLTLTAALACDRVPLSLGTGIDDLVDDDGSNSGTAGTGAGGSGSAGTGSGGAQGDDCNDTYILCLESGELAEVCRDDLERCDYAGYPSTAGSGGTSTGGIGSGGYAGTGTAGTGAAGTGAGGAGSGGYAGTGAAGAGTGAAGAGAGGYAGTGAGGTGAAGTGAGGASADECDITYQRCLESGELPEICRDDLERCDYADNSGAAGTGSGGGASGGAGSD
jgi:hypothetical protein